MDGELEAVGTGTAVVTVSVKSDPTIFSDLTVVVALNPVTRPYKLGNYRLNHVF